MPRFPPLQNGKDNNNASFGCAERTKWVEYERMLAWCLEHSTGIYDIVNSDNCDGACNAIYKSNLRAYKPDLSH